MDKKLFNLLFMAWAVALASCLGSLFFSEIMGFVPCSLCWYQRIFMYPLVLVLGIGLFPLNKEVFKFSMPLVISGWIFAFYHNLLHWGIISESLAPCTKGVACSTVYINWLGFITIPLLSIFSFIGKWSMADVFVASCFLTFLSFFRRN